MYQLITVSGPDAESFLQGQLTQDVRAVSPARAVPAAACTPKGRVLATLLLCRRADGFDLIVPGDIAEALLQRLTLYKLRARVELQLREDLLGFAVDYGSSDAAWSEIGLLPEAGTFALARSGENLAVRIDEGVLEVFAPGVQPLAAAAATLDQAAWATAWIGVGRVSIGAASTEKFTPHMLSLDLAGAVSFDKGCYTGQEVVARTEHLGKSRRRLMRYIVEGANAAAGDELTFDDNPVGTVVNAGDGEILAVTPQELHEKTLQINGGVARPAMLPWS